MKIPVSFKLTLALVAFAFLASLRLSAQEDTVALNFDVQAIVQDDTDPNLFYVNLTTVNFQDVLGIDVFVTINGGATIDSVEFALTSIVASADPTAANRRRLFWVANSTVGTGLADGSTFARLWVRGDLETMEQFGLFCFTEAVIQTTEGSVIAPIPPCDADSTSIIFEPLRSLGGIVFNADGMPLTRIEVSLTDGTTTLLDTT
ncbi:MAG: hypothetical protein AAF828_02410, partial [Bacteroidota bacterium]